MDAIKEFLRAADRLEHEEIDIGEYEKLCEPLRDVRENVHGEWIAYQDGKYHCSRCDDVAPKGYRWNYCPNCGADMRKGREDARNGNS